ncbi:adenylate/guanylate cyclase domain-containing protein [Oscillatoria sp. CS-180]|uniref:adenylate/guanylate cyclase domain-containing protein n=1 Tax=Oscillatoria sp. CS-180 TaxID=3021720 RepID=UPI00232AC3DA|nr:adenylate/guanylate cyclase domain-containing protein [Oscillatoria sp. CS-180]MDB9524476.1 adenylate/guanylate cyclase domain-containing protein [Oscillatoria sp. CS-180]
MNTSAEPIDTNASKVGQQNLLLLHTDAFDVRSLSDLLEKDASYCLQVLNHLDILPEFLRDNKIELILLETQLFERHSYRFCYSLKNKRATRDIPVIVLGDRDPQRIAAAFSAGACDYISSPFLAEEVTARVHHHLMRYRRRQQLSHQNKLLLEEVRERKQVEDTLQQTQDKYRRIFENATEGIFQSSKDGTYISVNPALAQIFGYDSPEDLMENLTNIGSQLYVQPKRRDELVVYLQQFKQIVGAESEVYRKDRTKIWISETIREVYDDGDSSVYYEGIVHDITESRRIEMELRQQRQQADRLLVNILPYQIAARLKAGARTIAESFDEVTVLFADLVEFTAASGQMVPKELVEMLNDVFSIFDRLAEKHGLEKIKTIGDAYMAAAGLPVPRPDHADAVALMALDMQKEIAKFTRPDGQPFQLRIGINTGSVIAGVIGMRKFAYDLWGDTVNIASRMETTGVAGRIQVTSEVYERLCNRYNFELRGSVLVKGRGQMQSYWLTGRKNPL